MDGNDRHVASLDDPLHAPLERQCHSGPRDLAFREDADELAVIECPAGFAKGFQDHPRAAMAGNRDRPHGAEESAQERPFEILGIDDEPDRPIDRAHHEQTVDERDVVRCQERGSMVGNVAPAQHAQLVERARQQDQEEPQECIGGQPERPERCHRQHRGGPEKRPSRREAGCRKHHRQDRSGQHAHVDQHVTQGNHGPAPILRRPPLNERAQGYEHEAGGKPDQTHEQNGSRQPWSDQGEGQCAERQSQGAERNQAIFHLGGRKPTRRQRSCPDADADGRQGKPGHPLRQLERLHRIRQHRRGDETGDRPDDHLAQDCQPENPVGTHRRPGKLECLCQASFRTCGRNPRNPQRGDQPHRRDGREQHAPQPGPGSR